MANRRSFLTSTVVLATVGLAGCTGNGSETESTTQPSTATPTQTEISTPTPTATATPTPTPTATPTPTSAPSTETEQQALEAYRAGYQDFNNATTVADGASNYLSEGEYQTAEEEFRRTLQISQDAAEHFEGARTLANQASKNEAGDVADEASKHLTEYWIPWSEAGINASEAAQDGQMDEAREYTDEAADLTENSEYAESIITTPAEFREALDI